MSEQALSNKLRGLKNFTLRDVSRIADFFDVSTDFVLGRAPLECTCGNPYRFACRIKVAGSTFGFDGLDMGDLQAMKGAINKAMTHARRARREWEGAQ